MEEKRVVFTTRLQPETKRDLYKLAMARKKLNGTRFEFTHDMVLREGMSALSKLPQHPLIAK